MLWIKQEFLHPSLTKKSALQCETTFKTRSPQWNRKRYLRTVECKIKDREVWWIRQYDKTRMGCVGKKLKQKFWKASKQNVEFAFLLKLSSVTPLPRNKQTNQPKQTQRTCWGAFWGFSFPNYILLNFNLYSTPVVGFFYHI